MNMLEPVREKVRALKPGFAIVISRSVMDDVFTEPPWSPAEWVLEGVAGSAYEFTATEDKMTGNMIFRRLNKPVEENLRTFVSADRKHRFTLRPHGFYEPRATSPTHAPTP